MVHSDFEHTPNSAQQNSSQQIASCCCVNDEIHSEDNGHDHSHSEGQSNFQMFLPAILSGSLLLIGLVGENFLNWTWLKDWVRFAWYGFAYIPVGFPVLREALESIQKKDIFSEFLLMSIATIGAFVIGEYPEGVAVMLFYAIGESFQGMAVSKAKRNIKALLDQRPDYVTIIRDGATISIPAKEARIGEVVQLKPGEKLALDGVLLSDIGSFNTAALTGESVPVYKKESDIVWAGSINQSTPVQIRITTAYEDSKLSKILEMVQHATTQKAPTELFIRKFARIYTPIVVFLALGICFLPYLFVEHYVFREWLYRSLIFLVVSCPCALVISIPLGYFGGIGAASRNGILVKGSNFLDLLAKIDNVVTDKTGTLTEGVFKVQEVVFEPWVNSATLLKQVNALENISTHPVASAIHEYVGTVDPTIRLDNIQEVAGMGLQAFVDGKSLLVGNVKLLKANAIVYPLALDDIVYTVLAIGYDGKYAGYITIADNVKKDASDAVKKLHELGVKVTMLSGDKDNVVQKVATTLKIDQAYGDLLPEDKVQKLQAIKALNQSVAFVGDGVNDAPVVAISDVGIAMGGLGSDATIETADVIIQDDKPSKIPMAIQIGKQTKRIVWQNITMAFVVKAIVLILGAGGLATMWEAVFADVGVALLAILNAVRIQRMQF